MKMMNKDPTTYFTFTFCVDPELNGGYTEAFKQGDEPWWWYTNEDEGPAVGPTPNFAGATFKSLHQWNTQLLL
jgi:hypothetical protein